MPPLPTAPASPGLRRRALLASLGASLALPPALPAAAQTPPPAIVVSAREGGSNPGFCMPQWSIANETGQAVGALLIQLEWRSRAGRVLEPAAPLGSLIEPFGPGRRKDLSLSGHPVPCAELRLVVGRYACRDAQAVRMPCPGPLRAQAPGRVEIDLSAAQEGPMTGAVERR
ncbi:hypothetical protein [Piscinibacter sakaiensis]|uniref:Uncharacterized protein n=1 Tax=Piscinibacter sakaiensis TaxID=1547922 RepID=A0A0K8NWI2_PISS1|nr:hypothetical protein [Piscinibacter sakaiensis]GAP34733.1 hypothetical protein ISF6_5441 [Piscinibacter sakaiensis]